MYLRVQVKSALCLTSREVSIAKQQPSDSAPPGCGQQGIIYPQVQIVLNYKRFFLWCDNPPLGVFKEGVDGLMENGRKERKGERLKGKSWIDRGDRRGSPTAPIIYNFGPNSKCEFHAKPSRNTQAHHPPERYDT
jgi:hypothetical protein